MKRGVRTWPTREQAQAYAESFVPDAAEPEVVAYHGAYAILMYRTSADRVKSYFLDVIPEPEGQEC